MVKIKRLFSVKPAFLLFIAIITSVVCLAPGASVFAAVIQVVDNGSTIVVNTGAGLTYTIDKSNGDMTSCILNGTELIGTKPSHINSGLWDTTVTWNKSPSGGTVIITVAMDTLTQYYISRSHENIIYMATYTTAEPSVGELRYIFRGNKNVLTNVPAESDLRGNTGAIESSDVYGFSSTGYTASKYYGNNQAKDLTIRGVTGTNVGVFMAYGNRETSSGGPFFRDIQFQSGSDTEVYNYMNSGHAQTEDFRTGFHGPYALVFTTGSTPSVPDFDWMSSLGLSGWVASRGNVILNGLSGMDSSYTYTIGFANSNAQYWTTASSTGSAGSYSMKPGTYVMTVYKGELAVYTENVTVNAGSTTTLHTRTITNDPTATPVIWRIGYWDGRPKEFLNGQTIVNRHPSDSRNASWGPVTYTVGNATNKFPAVQFRGQNTPTVVHFTLNATQAASAHSLKIGLTTAYNGGRPNVTINGHTMTYPAASIQPKSRNVTIGTYRGNNTSYTWSIPASYFVSGTNTLSISVVSGSSDLGNWLSAGWAYDCVELGN